MRSTGRRPGPVDGRLPAVGQPSGDEAVVLGPALGGAELAEVEIAAVEGHDGLTGGLVETE